jgi:hypothetical protein
MANSIYPSNSKAVSGAGTFQGFATNNIQDVQLSLWMKASRLSPLNAFVLGGLTLSTSPGVRGVYPEAGSAFIDGYYVTLGAQTYLQVDDNASATPINSYVYMTLGFTGGQADNFTFSTNTTGVLPADSVCIGVASVASHAVVGVTNAAVSPRIVTGTYTGAGTGQNIFLGFQPQLVVAGRLGGAYELGIALWNGAGGLELIPGNTPPEIDRSGTFPAIYNQGFSVSGVLTTVSQTFYYQAWA